MYHRPTWLWKNIKAKCISLSGLGHHSSKLDDGCIQWCIMYTAWLCLWYLTYVLPVYLFFCSANGNLPTSKCPVGTLSTTSVLVKKDSLPDWTRYKIRRLFFSLMVRLDMAENTIHVKLKRCVKLTPASNVLGFSGIITQVTMISNIYVSTVEMTEILPLR